MTQDPSRETRIVLASHGAAVSGSVLDLVRSIMRHVQGELSGLFVEDARMLTAAALPLTREVGRVSGIVRPFETADMARLLQYRARSFQAQLAVLAKELARPWTCETCRGDFAQQTLRAIEVAQLVVVGTGDAMTSARPGDHPITVLMEPDNTATLAMAAHLARARGARLQVVMRTKSLETFARARQDMRRALDAEWIQSIEPSLEDMPKILDDPHRPRARDVLVLSANLLPGLLRHSPGLLSRWAGRLVLVADLH